MVEQWDQHCRQEICNTVLFLLGINPEMPHCLAATMFSRNIILNWCVCIIVWITAQLRRSSSPTSLPLWHPYVYVHKVDRLTYCGSGVIVGQHCWSNMLDFHCFLSRLHTELQQSGPCKAFSYTLYLYSLQTNTNTHIRIYREALLFLSQAKSRNLDLKNTQHTSYNAVSCFRISKDHCLIMDLSLPPSQMYQAPVQIETIRKDRQALNSF